MKRKELLPEATRHGVVTNIVHAIDSMQILDTLARGMKLQINNGTQCKELFHRKTGRTLTTKMRRSIGSKREVVN
jgi:hypothetical protein